MKTLTLKQIEKIFESTDNSLQGLCDGVSYLEADANPGDKAIKTTLGELAALRAGTVTGTEGEPRFIEVGKLYPNAEVYTVLTNENTVLSCDIMIDSDEMGEKIGELTGLRFDDAGSEFPDWYYFEAE
jgi:hypothetical protein